MKKSNLDDLPFLQPKSEDSKKNEWNNYFKPSGYKLVKRCVFWKVFAVLCFVFFFGSIGFLCYLGYDGGFSGFISSNFNSSLESTTLNEYQNDFKNTVNNEYRHDIDNNFTIYNNIFIEGVNCS